MLPWVDASGDLRGCTCPTVNGDSRVAGNETIQPPPDTHHSDLADLRRDGMATNDTRRRERRTQAGGMTPTARPRQHAADEDRAAMDGPVAQRPATYVAQMRHDRFTPDQTTVDIIAALAGGHSCPAAAESLHISESTVRRKLARARAGWDVNTNTEVVVIAVRAGLI